MMGSEWRPTVRVDTLEPKKPPTPLTGAGLSDEDCGTQVLRGSSDPSVNKELSVPAVPQEPQ